MTHRLAPINDPNTFHMVLCDHGRFGLAYRETEPGLTDGKLATLIGENEIDAKIVHILAVNPTTGTCRDATDDIGSLVFYGADADGNGFARLNDAARALCEKAGFDIDAEQEAFEAKGEVWDRQLRSTLPGLATHL